MLYDCKEWTRDIDRVSAVVPELDRLAGHSLMITGAAGLVCSAVVDVIFRYNDTHSTPIRILAAGRSIGEMRERFVGMVDRPDFIYVPYDATRTDNAMDEQADYIIHGASNAYPSLVMKEPVETMLGNFLGIRYLLDYARSVGTRRVLYISSSEVYGRKKDSEPYREDEYGYVDQLNPRNSYAVSKRAAETLCASYAAEYGIESVVVRPGHIYGPTAGRQDTRISSAWAYDAAAGRDIVMKSDGAQIRSYCHCLDCATAILKVLLCGENCRAYNISNPASIISIRGVAEILTCVSGTRLRLELPEEAEKKGFNPMDNASLEAEGLLGLGWHGCFDAEAGFGQTVRLLREVSDLGKEC